MMLRALLACSLLFFFGQPSTVAAQERPVAALLQSTHSQGVEEGVVGAFERMLRQRLDALDVVSVGRGVALDLAQIQLALGCLGDNVACLEAVASEVGAPLVLAPSLDVAGEELIASVLLFDERDGSQRRAIRRATGSTAPTLLLEAVDGMLRELFGLPPPDELPSDLPRVLVPEERTPVVPREPTSLSPLPFVVIGVGAAAVVGGAIVGALAASDEEAYRASRPTTSAEVDETLGTLDRARAEALAANVLWIAGGAIAAGGLVWLLVAGNENATSPLAVVPVAGPGYAGVSISGSFGGAL